MGFEYFIWANEQWSELLCLPLREIQILSGQIGKVSDLQGWIKRSMFVCLNHLPDVVHQYRIVGRL